MKPAKVYAITHDPTGARYVGSTLKPLFYRFRQHIVDLDKGVHTSKKFQKLWTSSSICDWSFKVLEILEVGRHRARLIAEKAWLDKLQPELRLNDNTRLQTYDRYAEVLRRIKNGEKYKDISKATGLSIGTISIVKNKRLDRCF